MQCKKICSNQISELFVACIDLFLLGLIHLMEVRKLIEKEKGEKLHVATQHDLYSFLQKKYTIYLLQIMHGNKLSYINFDYIETRIQFSIKYKDTPKSESIPIRYRLW